MKISYKTNELFNRSIVHAQSSGSKISSREIDNALKIFLWDNGTVDKNEVKHVKKKISFFFEALNSQAFRKVQSWIKRNNKVSSENTTTISMTDAFRKSVSTFLYDTPSKPHITGAEIEFSLKMLGSKPTPARILEVDILKAQLSRMNTPQTTLQSIDKWLTKHKADSGKNNFSAAIAPVLRDLLWPSESDRPIKSFLLTKKESALAPSNRLLLPKEFLSLVRENPASHIEHFLFDEVLKQRTTVSPDMPETELQQVLKFTELRKFMEETFTQLQVFKVGDVDKDLYIIGRDSKGNLGGIVTSVVET